MYVVTVLHLKDWFIIIGVVLLIIWLTGGYIWGKIKNLFTREPK